MKEALKRRLAIVHLISGSVLLIISVYFFIWPGIVAFILKVLLIEMPDVNGVMDATAWTIAGIVNILILVAFVWLIIAAPYFAAFNILLCAIPSIVGSITIFRSKAWGMKLIRFCSFPYLLIFPLGTILAIYTFITLRRIKRL